MSAVSYLQGLFPCIVWMWENTLLFVPKISSQRKASQQCAWNFLKPLWQFVRQVLVVSDMMPPFFTHPWTPLRFHSANRWFTILSLQCVDLNECLSNPCGSGAKCINQFGGYICECPPGAKGDPYTGCGVVDLCQSSPCGLNARCRSEGGTYRSVSSLREVTWITSFLQMRVSTGIRRQPTTTVSRWEQMSL